tara:strand:+ start:77 stop:469 length:393 start_codon:yes stop_codon:yes gene_type:complete
MSEQIYHNIPGAPKHVAPFSHAVECDGWIQLTGQMPTNPENDLEPLFDDIGIQTRRVMDNLIIVLNGLGLDLKHVVSARVYLTHFKRDYAVVNDIYKSYFSSDSLPARTCVGVTALARDALIEIDMVAKR